ncbi:MAG: hypothetical protein P5678_12575, partial [Limnospira sp. PMC 1240.20]|nr:hypothetical protein [Limnospira sp. PMC 1240.20]MDT9261032.1 hypothetical protein [Limnospira sp. PMC 1236.20]
MSSRRFSIAPNFPKTRASLNLKFLLRSSKAHHIIVFWGYILLSSRKTPGRVGSSVIDRGEENRLKRLTAASTPLR